MTARQGWGLLVLAATLTLAVVALARSPEPAGVVVSADGFVAPATAGTPTTSGSASPGAPGTTHTKDRGANATSTTARHGTGGRITLAFVGDVNFTGPVSARLAADPATALAPIAPILSKADVTVANLETSITDGGTPANKQYTFRAPPAALTAVKAAGIDVVTLANNHSLDYGPGVVADALAASKATGEPVIGIGQDEAQAFAPYRVTVRGNRVAIIGATQVIDTDLIDAWTATPNHPGLASAKRVDDLLAAVRAARPSTDTLVVFLHWGQETLTCPTPDQQTLAKQLVDAGADIIVGSHTHRVEGAGRLGNAIVDYGLGNFVFDANSSAAATTGIFEVETGGDQDASYSWQPGVIGSSNLPTFSTGADATNALQAWNQLRACTGLAD